MQIRKQLKAQGDAIAVDGRFAVCPQEGNHRGLGKVCGLGFYHSKHMRTRWKAQKGPSHRGSGTAPRKTKKGGQ